MATGINYIVVSGAKGAQELFVSLYSYFISAQAQAVGVTLIANSTGSNNASGFNYWDLATPAGNNAWAVFQWASASVPFCMLMQVATGTQTVSPGNSFGGIPGNPGVMLVNGYSTADGVGIQFAARANGTSPWNGTTGAVGSDTKGTPVWISGSSHLYVWPRANSVAGTYVSNKEFCLTLANADYIRQYACRVNVTIDQNNVFFSRDSYNDVGSYNYFYFGKYQPYSGSHRLDMACVPDVPYVMLRDDNETGLDPTVFLGTSNLYGSLTAVSTNLDGGVAFPTGSAPYEVVTCVADTLGGFPFSNTLNPNQAYPTSGYDEYPIMIFMNEMTLFSGSGFPTFGMLGQVEFMKLVYGLAVGDTDTNYTRIVLGSKPTYTAGSRYTVPWSGIAPVMTLLTGTGGSRTGTIY